MNSKSIIHTFLNKWDNHPFDSILSIVNSITDWGMDPWAVIKEILIYPSQFGNESRPLIGVSTDELEKLISYYQRYLLDLLHILAIDNPPEDTFYQKLYQQLFESNLLNNNPVIQSVCIFILYHNILLVPYHQLLNPLKLDTLTFNTILKRIGPQIRLSHYVRARLYDTKTEETSQYWEIANTLKTREEQVVFWYTVLVDESNTSQKSTQSSDNDDD